jgi:hypothetical protein
VGLGSVRGRKFILSRKVKGRVLAICLQYDTFAPTLPSATLLSCFWLNLYSVDILRTFWCPSCCDDLGLYRYVVKLPDIFYCQGQVFKFRNFFSASILGTLWGHGVTVTAVPVTGERYGVTVTAVPVTGALLFSCGRTVYQVCWSLLFIKLYMELHGCHINHKDLNNLQSQPTHFYERGY